MGLSKSCRLFRALSWLNEAVLAKRGRLDIVDQPVAPRPKAELELHFP